MEINIVLWRLSITLYIFSDGAGVNFYFYFAVMWQQVRRGFMISLFKDYLRSSKREAIMFSIGIFKYFYLKILKEDKKEWKPQKEK